MTTDLSHRERDLDNSKELRLALVCYGGVSLAIYMHGVTKEIHKLVSASAGQEERNSTNTFKDGETERVYWDALSNREEREGLTTRVVVDVVAGTSAGGINGVVAAKALAHGLNQDDLRDLWMDKADLTKLLDAPGIGFGPTRWRIGSRLLSWIGLKGIGEVTSTFDQEKQPRHPLRGDLMLSWVYEALENMDQTAQDPTTSLMPEDHALRLFVTLTDYYGYTKRLPIYNPPHVLDGEHRHVMEFRYSADNGKQPSDDQFGPKYNGPLAFAARATSSFPGGFPPIDFENLARGVGGPSGTLREFFDIYTASGADPAATYFVDGGILDNFPFGHAIDAVIEAPAHSEVERYLVYLEPDPGAPPDAPPGVEPHWISNIWGGLSGIAAKEPIIDDLTHVAEFNDRVQRINDLIDGVEDQVTGQLQSGADLHDTARQSLGLAYDNYVWMKLDSVLERLGTLAAASAGWPDGSTPELVINDIIRGWAMRPGGILERTSGLELSEDQIGFLKTFDLDYGRRRIRFVIQGLNELYADVGQWERPNRDHIDRAKDRLYQLADELDVGRLLGTERGSQLSGGAARLFDRMALAVAGLWGPPPPENADDAPADPVAAFVSDHAEDLDELYAGTAGFLNTELRDFGDRLRNTFEDVTNGWDPGARDRVNTRFVGFPIWDVLVFPLRRFSDVGELSPINVVRFSPEDSTLLSDKGASKLKGSSWKHFGAFFDRPGREADYLWGRLDAAERILWLLGEDDESLYRDAFRAIVEDERSALTPEVVEVIEQALDEKYGQEATP